MAEKFLIVGLGNPGKQYENTRHNIGFMVLEALAKHAGISGKPESRFNAIVGTGHHNGCSLILAQPLTFMNCSGEAVSKLLKYYDLEPDRLLIVYDEAALPFGRVRIRPGGSSAGQKGMKSIIDQTGTQDIPRLRIGIGSPPAKMAMPNFVLSKFDGAEQKDLSQVIDTTIQAIECYLKDGMERCMEQYNGLDIIAEKSL
jgi:PTH1 family peptidyl-tRNA hydrolase